MKRYSHKGKFSVMIDDIPMFFVLSKTFKEKQIIVTHYYCYRAANKYLYSFYNVHTSLYSALSLSLLK